MKKNEIFTVENAKIANVTYRFYTTGRKGYITDSEGIVKARVKSVTIDLKAQEVSTCLADDTGKEYIRNGEFNMYETPRHYEEGRPISKNDITALDFLVNGFYMYRRFNRVLVKEKTHDEPAYGYVEAWRFENGEPIATPLVINVISDTGSGFVVTDSQEPDKMWATRELAFRYNEYKVTDADGEVFVERGVGLRLSLTDEQLTAVEELKAAYDKARKAGVGFLWDHDVCGDIMAFNSDEVEDYGYDLEHYKNCSDVSMGEIEYKDTGIGFYDYNSCESEFRFCMKQTNRQKKEWLKSNPESDNA